jgi:flagellar export protein FliJ
MRRFHFALDGLGRVRSLAVREHEVALARAREDLAIAEAVHDRRAAEYHAAMRLAPRGSVISVRRLMERDASLTELRRQVHEQERRVAGAEARVATVRAGLVEARKEERALEKLRERRYREFTREVLRQEQKGHDETAARRVREARAA